MVWCICKFVLVFFIHSWNMLLTFSFNVNNQLQLFMKQRKQAFETTKNSNTSTIYLFMYVLVDCYISVWSAPHPNAGRNIQQPGRRAIMSTISVKLKGWSPCEQSTLWVYFFSPICYHNMMLADIWEVRKVLLSESPKTTWCSNSLCTKAFWKK